MFQIFKGETANDAWLEAASSLTQQGASQTHVGRGGATQEILHAAFSFNDPTQRWVSSRWPPINPAFALAEVVWILTGRRDRQFLDPWNSQLRNFVGEDPDLHGAYGYRLKYGFGIDQLERGYQA